MFPYDYFLYPLLIPKIPSMNEQPPTLYSLLNTILNHNKEEKTKIRNLAKEGRKYIFDFEYPLSNYVNKEEFETNILNHFLKRRIGYQTPVDFLIHLETKMNEIMPFYNKMFDVLENFTIDGEKTIKEGSNISNNTANNTNTRTIDRTGKDEIESENTIENEASTETSVTDDKRFSQLPQSEIQNVQNASYLTDYTYTQNSSESTDNSTSTGTSNSTTEKTENTRENQVISNNENGQNNYNEVINRIDPKYMFEYLERMKNIYSLIYKDLDILFYQLIY